MKLETIATHTVDLDLLPKYGGVVLDAGCRDFDFHDEMTKRGLKVVPIDADFDIWKDRVWEWYNHTALVGHERGPNAYFIQAGNGSRVVFDQQEALKRVPTVTVDRLAETFGKFDLVKLDIEGSEYEVLLSWPGLIANQISVEFHEHTKRGKDVHGADIYDRIDKHLSQWYTKVKDDPMDTLWVRK